ncbi:Mu-like prophage major head subunit gpT family protein [Dyella lutea]|uniref:Mu-like prophage major head subunit gpT family protein n=1 Tax=Dyella lutea TaxID=2950441 RepID=A0ABT1FDE8_9GAMM|nr:Mu-like prophage major head subunit gpT family protein [Dyella lutea]MCP1375385.1 Mu-like prophage major head subunit gpT family protein [Dyella lutea]
MLVNKENLSLVFINLKTTFNKAFDAAPTQWDKTAMLVPSGSSQNNYDWLDRFPKMRKWIGDKVIRALTANQYTVVNDDWEATVGVRRNDIEDDNLGIYAPMAQDAGYSAKTLPDEIVSDLKNNAFVNKCYDGQYFYDTDHPVGDGNGNTVSVSNKGTAKLDSSTRAAATASYGAARTAIMNMTDNEGRKLGLVPNVLEVPPALEAVARIICEAPKLDDNGPNPFKGTATVLVNPRLSSATAWFLHCTDRPVKPYIYQQRKAPVFVQQINPEADDVFSRGEYKYGAEARAAGGYSFWQMSYGSDGSA